MSIHGRIHTPLDHGHKHGQYGIILVMKMSANQQSSSPCWERAGEEQTPVCYGLLLSRPQVGGPSD
jgi:hypothetical protein